MLSTFIGVLFIQQLDKDLGQQPTQLVFPTLKPVNTSHHLYIPVAMSQIWMVLSHDAVANFRSSREIEQLEIAFSWPLQHCKTTTQEILTMHQIKQLEIAFSWPWQHCKITTQKILTMHPGRHHKHDHLRKSTYNTFGCNYGAVFAWVDIMSATLKIFCLWVSQHLQLKWNQNNHCK